MVSEIGPQDLAQERAQELGYPAPEPRPDRNLPPGGGKLAIPHVATFSQVVNLASRTYRWTHDEALRHSQVNSLAMRRDVVVMDALRSRQIPVVQLAWHLEPEDDTDNRQMVAVKGLTKIIERIPRFQNYKLHLQEATWYGRYAVQNVLRWDYSTGQRQLVVADYKPINGDKLVFKHSGQAGILVHAAHYEGSSQYTDRGRAHFLSPEEREQFVIHIHEPEDADFYEGELAGGIFGVGIRSRIYYLWWLRSQVLAFLMDYLERVGAGGFTIYFFESGNTESLNEVKVAAEEQWRHNSILFPRYRDGSTGGPGVQRIEPSMAGAALLESLIVNYFDNVIRRFILGQSLTSEAVGTGLGSGVADLHADTFNRIVKFDAINLQETLTKDLVSVLCKYNYPGVPCPKFVFDVDKPNAQAVLEAARQFYEMGGEVDEDELRGILGLAKPEPGHGVLAKMPALQPAGVGAMPQGLPMEGMPGPMPPDQPGPLPADQTPPIQMRRRGVVVRYSAQQAHPHLLELVLGYMKQRGQDYQPLADYKKVGPELARRIAAHYEASPHAPHHPEVKQSYDALKQETLDQFKYLQSKGVKFTPWNQEGQPYSNSAEMVQDVHHNKHLYFFPTKSGFGGDVQNQDHPLLESTGLKVDGHDLLYNDAFRAVHDFFGHALYSNQFGPRGEEHAWRTHRQMYSVQAQPAMSFETRGQNSWVNFGPHVQEGQPLTERPYAEQKANILPPELMQDHP